MHKRLDTVQTTVSTVITNKTLKLNPICVSLIREAKNPIRVFYSESAWFNYVWSIVCACASVRAVFLCFGEYIDLKGALQLLIHRYGYFFLLRYLSEFRLVSFVV